MFTTAMFVEQFWLSKPNSADFAMIYWDSVNITSHVVSLKKLDCGYLSRFSIVTVRKAPFQKLKYFWYMLYNLEIC